MATTILVSQDILRRRFNEVLTPQPNPSSHLNRHALSHRASRRRKHTPPASRRGKHTPPASRSRGCAGVRVSQSRCALAESPATSNKIVMEHVKILKRGETLIEFQKKERSRDRERRGTGRLVMTMNIGCSEDFDLVLGSTGGIGGNPDTVTKQIGARMRFGKTSRGFAGACCSVSPPPTSVPIPEFLGKRNKRVV